jgi:hypothetical protein
MVENNSFTRPVRVESIPGEGLEQRIEASQAERAALARLDGLPAIGRLAAEFTLRRVGRGIIQVRGEVHAEVTQTCVVSLEPFDVTLNEPVDVRFAAPTGEGAGRRAPPITAAEVESFAIGDHEAADPIVDGKIDLGALAAEFMILGLDPYPRKPGVEFTPPSDEEARDAPFAKLGDGPKNN